MESAIVVRYTDPRQANLFGNGKLVLHKFDSKKQDPKARRAIRSEIDSLSLKYRVRRIQTHDNVILDTNDISILAAEVYKVVMPCADAECTVASLIEALEAACLLVAEGQDLVDVITRKLENKSVDWRELPCMQETPRPIFAEVI